MLQVADRWEAEAPLIAASDILCARSTTSMRDAVYSLPAVLKNITSFSAVMAAAEAQLLATFKEAHSIFVSSERLQQFNALSLEELKILLSNFSFAADSEETVLHLARSWCMAQPYSDHNVTLQVRSLIRYRHISAPYSMGVCEPGVMPPLTQHEIAQVCEYVNIPERSSLPPSCFPEWFLPKRPSPPSYDGVLLNLAVHVEQLGELLACISDGSSSFITSDEMYGEGFLWALRLVVNEQGELWCVVVARGVANPNTLSGAALEHGVYASIKLQIADPSDPTWPLKVMTYREWRLVTSEGPGDMVQMTGEDGAYHEASGLDWWQRYAESGVIKISAGVTRRRT